MEQTQVFLSIAEVAKRYSITTEGVRTLARRGQLPTGVKIGGKLRRWSVAELEDWDREKGYLSSK